LNTKPSYKKVTKEEPYILIYHTHSTEGYEILDLGWYAKEYNSRTKDTDKNMVRVGDELTKILEESGYNVIHDRNIYDESYDGAYSRSRVTVEKYLEKYRRIDLLMHEMTEAEASNRTDIDTMAGLFGQIMAQIVVCKEDEWAEYLSGFAFYLGKFIYLMDAYEDIEADLKKGTYNPLKSKYHHPDFEGECRTILTMMMSECCREFEKLPILENVEILRNILHSGVWCRYEAVHEKRMGIKGEKNE
jgi:stage II sporulation protein P